MSFSSSPELWQRSPVRRAAFVIGIVGLIAVAPIAAVPAYDFPEARPFSGSSWRNPYEGWWGGFQKVNLHSHSKAWGGITAGASSSEALANTYVQWGFKALAISNYFEVTHLDAPPLPMVRAYEHGLNFTKSHRLVLGTDDVVALDFPISTRSARQWLLNVIGRSGALVGLNHPALRQGHACSDTEALTGYQLFEVHNPYATSAFEWDCALSAGRLVWAMGNDDSHSTREEGIGIAWNMVGTQALDETSILSALGQGRSYVVRGERGQMDAEVLGLTVDASGAMRVELSQPAARVEWLTDGGSVRQVDLDVDRSTFTPHPHDHYVRVVIRTPRTEVVLNPIVRSGNWTAPVASIDWPLTFGSWFAWLVGAAAVAWLGRPRQHLRLVSMQRAA